MNPVNPVRRERVRAWFRLARLLRHTRAAVLVPTAVLSLCAGLLPLVFVVAMGQVTKDLTASHPGPVGMSTTVGRAGAALVLAFAALAIQQVVAPLQEALAVLAARRIDQVVLRSLLAAALHAPLERVEQESAVRTVAEVTDVFQRNVPTPGVAAAALPRLAGRYLGLAGAIALVGVTVSWPVAALLAVGAVTIRQGQRGSMANFAREWAALAEDRRRMTYLQSLGVEPGAAKEIRVLGLLPWLRARYTAHCDDYLPRMWRRRRAVFFRPFLGYSAIGFALATAAFAVLCGDYRPAEGVVVLVVAAQAMLVPLRFGVHFPECDTQTQYGLQTLEQIEQYTAPTDNTAPEPDAVPRVLSAPPAPRRRDGAREIRFDGVGFRYPGGTRPVLEGLDLVLEPGRSTALVGVNGAGKTTLVKLLTGGYPPGSGRILVDGTDLAGVDARAWSREVSVIFQHFVRFDLTLRDNVLLGAAHLPPDDAALRRALDRARASEFADTLPRGLETVPAPEYAGGRGLSGGQWQRVALARALYAVERGATVLVLDEPTSQLDVRSEIDFFDRFMELTEGLTTLVISHRFSTVRRADKIAILDGGRITQCADHDTLVAADGAYAAMFRAQADRFQDALVREAVR